MKTILRSTLMTVAAAGLLLAGCSKNDAGSDLSGPSTKISAITVRAGGFVATADGRSVANGDGTAACEDAGMVYPREAVGAGQSRATDAAYYTEFDEGDQIGLTVVKPDGTFLQNNMALTYGCDGDWHLPADEALWSLEGLEYVAYYPYDEAMGGIIAGAANKTGAGIKAAVLAAFSPLADQSTYAAYTASDLMLWSGQPNMSGAAPKLDIALEHAMSLMIVEPRGAGCEAPDGAAWAYHGAAVYSAPANTDLGITVGGVAYTPYAMLDGGNSTVAGTTPGEWDGTWRVLVKPAAAAAVSVEYETLGILVGWNSPAGLLTPGAAQYLKYNINPPASLPRGERAAQAGDYYYVADRSIDPSAKDLVLPGGMMTEALKAGCSGVVSEVAVGGVTGKVLHMDEGGSLAWSTVEEVTPAGDWINGMSNTQSIKTLASWLADNNSYPSFKWCADKGDGWYLPALTELMALSGSQAALNPALTAIGGTAYSNSAYYWSSSENTSGVAVAVGNSQIHLSAKDTQYSVRAIRTF